MPVITPGATTVGATVISGLAPNSTPIESWLNGMLTGKAYGAQLGIAAVAAQFNRIELRNPAGSGKNLWVYTATGTTTAASNVTYSAMSPPLLATGGHGFNLSTGVAGGVAFIASGSSVSAIGSVFYAQFTLALNSMSPPYPWLIVLPPNTSVVMADGVQNDGLNASFLWMEV